MTAKFRILHTMLRVVDLDRSIDFYTKIFGMSVLQRTDFPEGGFTIAFVGYGPPRDEVLIELTHNWGRESYTVGDGFGHVALGVRDIYGICQELERAGANITRKPGPMMHGTTHIAFVEDPDGYKVELIDLDTWDV